MTIDRRTFNAIALVFIIFVLILIFSIPLSSCSKEGKKESENHCPTIAASAVPQVVKDSFALRYPAMTVNTWFQKDSIGYCAYFIQPVNQKKLAEFSTAGVFISEEIDNNHDGHFEDSTGQSNPKVVSVCECEILESE
jgi:hypothetical protein